MGGLMMESWGIQQTNQMDVTLSWDSLLDGVMTHLTSWYVAAFRMAWTWLKEYKPPFEVA